MSHPDAHTPLAPDAPGAPGAPPGLPSKRSLLGLAVTVLLVVGGTQGLNTWRERQSASDIKARLAGQRITLYSTADCIYCIKARDWMSRQGIPWEECDVEHDTGCKATFEAHGAPGTPVVRVGPHWRLGFEPAWIAQALADKAPAWPARPKPAPASAP